MLLDHGVVPTLDEVDNFWAPRLDPKKTRYPGSPVDLRRMGLVNDKNFLEENLKIGEFIHFNMMKKLRIVERGILHCLGIGNFRERGFILPATEMGFIPNLWDACGFACGIASNFIGHRPFAELVRIHRMEILDAWSSGKINEHEAVAYFASQLIQVQKRVVMESMMCRLGLFVGKSIEKKVFLYHPFGEDNPPDKVEWGATIPYTEKDLLKPFEMGLGVQAKMEVLGCHKYFGHQTYKLVEFSRAV